MQRLPRAPQAANPRQPTGITWLQQLAQCAHVVFLIFGAAGKDMVDSRVKDDVKLAPLQPGHAAMGQERAGPSAWTCLPGSLLHRNSRQPAGRSRSMAQGAGGRVPARAGRLACRAPCGGSSRSCCTNSASTPASAALVRAPARARSTCAGQQERGERRWGGALR